GYPDWNPGDAESGAGGPDSGRGHSDRGADRPDRGAAIRISERMARISARVVRIRAAVTGARVALITPTLFSRPPDPLPHWEKRETVGVGRAARAFNVSSLSNVARCAQRTLRMPFSPSPGEGGRAGDGRGGRGVRARVGGSRGPGNCDQVGLAADLHEAHQVAVVALGEVVLGRFLLEDAEDFGVERGGGVGRREEGAEG